MTDCLVCGDPVDPDAGKFDDDTPVWVEPGDRDDFGGEAYHLGCEPSVFEEVYAEV